MGAARAESQTCISAQGVADAFAESTSSHGWMKAMQPLRRTRQGCANAATKRGTEMVISELISKLEKMRTDYGDARVEVRNEAGDWNDAEEVLATHYSKPASDPKWVVFIGV